MDSGESLPGSFAHYDPATSLWRTSQGCLFSQDLELYSETWPSAGTMRNGKCYPQPPLEPLTCERESGLWRTPQAADGTHNHCLAPSVLAGRTTIVLTNQVEMVRQGLWPTPIAVDGLKSGFTQKAIAKTKANREAKGEEYSFSLAELVAYQENGQLNPMWVEWLMGYPSGWTDLEDSATPWCLP